MGVLEELINLNVAILGIPKFSMCKSGRKTLMVIRTNTVGFWLICLINQRALYNHALSVVGVVLHRCLCTPPPGTGLDIVHIWYTYAHVSTIYAHQIFSDSNL